MSKIFSPLLLEVKRQSVTDTGQFQAYVSTYGPPPDEANDIILQGAFTDALAIHKARGTSPALLWHHDISQPIGTWINFTEDSHGLLGTAQLTLGVRKGAEALALLRDGAIALSIGFAVAPGGAETKSGIRIIKTIARLYEVSLVSIPCNPRATVKSKPETPRELERLLRDVAGFSARESKRLTAGGWPVFARDEQETEFDLVLSKIEQLHKLIEAKTL